MNAFLVGVDVRQQTPESQSDRLLPLVSPYRANLLISPPYEGRDFDFPTNAVGGQLISLLCHGARTSIAPG